MSFFVFLEFRRVCVSNFVSSAVRIPRMCCVLTFQGGSSGLGKRPKSMEIKNSPPRMGGRSPSDPIACLRRSGPRIRSLLLLLLLLLLNLFLLNKNCCCIPSTAPASFGLRQTLDFLKTYRFASARRWPPQPRGLLL